MSASNRSEAAGKKQGTKKRRYRRPLILRVLSSVGTVLMTTFLSFFLLFAVTGTICAIAATMYITNYMENTTPISIQDLEISGATNIFETKKDGELELVYHVQSEQKRIPVTLDQVPQHVRDAFVYGEDERFYEHEGVDFKRTAASFANMILKFWVVRQLHSSSSRT